VFPRLSDQLKQVVWSRPIKQINTPALQIRTLTCTLFVQAGFKTGAEKFSVTHTTRDKQLN
jgi:hypothetical protein